MNGFIVLKVIGRSSVAAFYPEGSKFRLEKPLTIDFNDVNAKQIAYLFGKPMNDYVLYDLAPSDPTPCIHVLYERLND